MINIENNSDTVIIVIHEIYGINQHMKDICQSLSEKDFDVICPNFLQQGAPFDYSQEEVAYDNFMKNIGFTHVLNKIKSLLEEIKDKYKKVYIIGFSVGATIAWLCSKDENINGIVGYYGSRIRDYVEIDPLPPIMLFFPQKEQSFDVDKLILCLEEKNIEIHKFYGHHGFSDPFSPKYNAKSAQEAFRKMVDFFLKH
ncbi:dienelactone hydrolase family protein [Neobacillus sp. NPDC097160]|uniref:dienelactone hydrolase family protein n=1 Tax=Neobacillus sp. NPDC097160 TaxID=3364298 RepID=UPI003803AFAB